MTAIRFQDLPLADLAGVKRAIARSCDKLGEAAPWRKAA